MLRKFKGITASGYGLFSGVPKRCITSLRQEDELKKTASTIADF